jgi:hypothetical protein
MEGFPKNSTFQLKIALWDPKNSTLDPKNSTLDEKCSLREIP